MRAASLTCALALTATLSACQAPQRMHRATGPTTHRTITVTPGYQSIYGGGVYMVKERSAHQATYRTITVTPGYQSIYGGGVYMIRETEH